MRRINFILPITILATSIILGGCSLKNNNKIVGITDQEAFKIVQNKYLKSPQFAYYKKFNSEEHIISYIKNEMASDENKLILLKKFAGDWVEDPIEQRTQNCFDNTEWVNIEKSPALYASCFGQGTGSGFEDFSLFSLSDKKIYYIDIVGGNYGEGVITKDQVDIDESLENNKSFLNFLEDKIANSKHLYSTKKEDLDMEGSKNATKKWDILNPDLYKYLEINQGEAFNINIEKYDTANIEDFFGEEVNKDYIKNSKWEAENSSYKITSYFKGAIYVYDKNENKYFVLWVPSDMYDWTEKIEFLDTHTIILYDRSENKQNYKIDLEKMTILKN